MASRTADFPMLVDGMWVSTSYCVVNLTATGSSVHPPWSYLRIFSKPRTEVSYLLPCPFRPRCLNFDFPATKPFPAGIRGFRKPYGT